MNILVACDSFKDALPANAVCRAIAAGIEEKPSRRSDHRNAPCRTAAKACSMCCVGPWHCIGWTPKSPIPWGGPSPDAMGSPPTARPAWWKWREASGLQRLTLAERDPQLTSTFGTGQLLADAKARGANRAILAIGGSATNDAGIGAAGGARLGLPRRTWQRPAAGRRASQTRRQAGRRAAAFRKRGSAVRCHQSLVRAQRRGLDLWPPERRQRCGAGAIG